jgi:uncharacterized membrane protein YfcA
MLFGTLFGAIIGMLIGATSIGGGVFVIPLLSVFFGLTTSQTIGSSIFIAMVLTCITSIIYSSGNQIDIVTAVIMTVGSLGGVFLGSRLSVKLPDRTLKGIVICIISFVTLIMFIGKSSH